MSNENNQEISADEVKVVISTCDSKVNGSFAGMIAVLIGEFGIVRLYDQTNLPTLRARVRDSKQSIISYSRMNDG